MSKDHWALIAVILVVGIVSSPIYTMYKFFNGMREANPQALAASVDFVRLRQSFKDEMRTMEIARGGTNYLDPDYVKVGDEMLESSITPSGLLALIMTTRTQSNTSGASDFRSFVNSCWLASPIEIECKASGANTTIVFATNNMIAWYMTEFRTDMRDLVAAGRASR